MTLSRLNRLASLMKDQSLEAVAINPGPTLIYLTGLHFHLSERPAVLLFSPQTDPVLILPELEAGKTVGLDIPIQPFAYGENPVSWPEVFRKACESIGLKHQAIGVEPTRFRFLELNLLQSALPEARFISAESVLVSLRIQKDEQEVKAMRKAVQIAQTAFEKTLPTVKIGVSEREIAAELSLQLLRAGSDTEFPFSPIIASGPNSANPHAVPTDRKLQPGDLIVIDWGATYEGYISDLTRTVAIGPVDPEFAQIAAVVLEANAAGRAESRPGISAGSIDKATRAVIDRANYGPYFMHRTGHGIGMEGHEAPYIFGDNNLTLTPGMAYTVEPGIYLPGRGGVRIEDNVVITENGAEVLTDYPRELLVLEP